MIKYLLPAFLFLASCSPQKRMQKLAVEAPEVVLKHCTEIYQPIKLSETVLDTFFIRKDSILYDCKDTGTRHIPIEYVDREVIKTVVEIDPRFENLYKITQEENIMIRERYRIRNNQYKAALLAILISGVLNALLLFKK